MSALMMDVVAVLLVVLALVFGVAALCVWRFSRRPPRVTLGLAAMCVLLLLRLPELKPEPYTHREQARVEAGRRRIAPTLERYRRAHGEYPSTLRAAGVKTPRSARGAVSYYAGRTQAGEPYCSLTYGLNEIDGFEAHWSSETGRWEVSRF